jgi:hypothetical protein
MEEKILEYFNDVIHNYSLKVLDNKYRKAYTGVSINYVTYDLLKGKYPKRKVAEFLLRCHKEAKIFSIFCPDVKKYVFEPKGSLVGNYNIVTGAPFYGNSNKNVHVFLEKIINKKKENE